MANMALTCGYWGMFDVAIGGDGPLTCGFLAPLGMPVGASMERTYALVKT